jgi:hypothetical protein
LIDDLAEARVARLVAPAIVVKIHDLDSVCTLAAMTFPSQDDPAAMMQQYLQVNMRQSVQALRQSRRSIVALNRLMIGFGFVLVALAVVAYPFLGAVALFFTVPGALILLIYGITRATRQLEIEQLDNQIKIFELQADQFGRQ